MTQELQSLIVEQIAPGLCCHPEAMRILGVSRQTIMQRVKNGELSVVHVSRDDRRACESRRPWTNNHSFFSQPHEQE